MITSTSEVSSMVDGEDIVIINFDEMTTKIEILTSENQAFKQENDSLKEELENANKRNTLLQNYLVAADERAAQTIYIEKVQTD